MLNVTCVNDTLLSKINMLLSLRHERAAVPTVIESTKKETIC